MPQLRPFILSAAVTALAAAVVINASGGHSPFAQVVVAAADEPVAAADLGDPPASPELAVVATDAPAADPATPAPTKRPSKPASTVRPASGAAPATPEATPAPQWTPRPTPRPTERPAPTPHPTPDPTERPTPTPTPNRQTGSLSISVSGGNPSLSWTTCSSSSFKAYAVVRSTDSEIHYPAEDHDTVVAMVTSRDATQLTDSAAPTGNRVWYAVWCLSQSDGEYKTIWRTPVVSVTP